MAREVYKSWENIDWDKAFFAYLFVWDKSSFGIPEEEVIKNVNNRLENLFEKK